MTGFYSSPLERNNKTQEPFLRLRKHPNVIITPPRTSDAAKVVEQLGDARIYKFLPNVPVPYQLEHAQAWLSQVIPQRQAVLGELETAPQFLTGCPFQFIRELQEDGKEEMIGNVHFVPYQHREVQGGNTLIPTTANSKKIWTMANWLAPSYHNKGIMSDAVDTILHDWAVPRMGAQRVIVSACAGNDASVKVFLKNGFRVADIAEPPINVRGEKVDLHTLEWNLE